MFGEDDRLVPAEDTLTVVPGHFGSYPNFLFEVDVGGVAAFVDQLRALKSDQDLGRFAQRYGIRRSDARFWASIDWLHADFRRREPTRAGLYDLGRYRNL